MRWPKRTGREMGARFRRGGRRPRARSVNALKGVRHNKVRAQGEMVEVKALRPRAKERARRKVKVLGGVKARKAVVQALQLQRRNSVMAESRRNDHKRKIEALEDEEVQKVREIAEKTEHKTRLDHAVGWMHWTSARCW